MTINPQYFILFLLLISTVGLSIILFIQWKQHKKELSAITSLLYQAQQDITSADERLNAVFKISQKFVEADREGDIVNELLGLSMKVSGAMGASFVPFDNHGQPLAAIRRGEFPFPVPDAWLEYMASPGIRSECMNCARHDSVVTTCPLLKGPFSGALGLFCLPLHRAERGYGILNLYMPNTTKLDDGTRIFINSLLDATALAIDGIRFRDSERETINRFRSVQQLADSKILVHELFENICEKLGADFGILVPSPVTCLVEKSFYPQGEIHVSGVIPSNIIGQMDVIAERIWTEGKEVSDKLQLNDEEEGVSVYQIIGMPVISFNNIQNGAVLIAKGGEEAFRQRHFSLLRTLTSQIGLVFQIQDQLSEITYKTMMDERIRLAREFHDGLAQTLGFLKLLVAQMQGYIDKRDFERLDRVAQTCFQTISGAYQDVREAIDGLRVSPEKRNGQPGSDLSVWLEQTVVEFQDNQEINSLVVSLQRDEYIFNISTEIQAQLVRIVQEALSNIRKHARASQVVISLRENKGDLILEIRDNGIGFSPEEVPGPSQHGLKGMRERTDLIGADFQIISLQGTGTTVRIRLPHSIYKQQEKYV